MKKPSSSSPTISSSPKRERAAAQKFGWVIGHNRFAKISAVEGIVLTPAMKVRQSALDRAGATAEERRAAITKAYKR